MTKRTGQNMRKKVAIGGTRKVRSPVEEGSRRRKKPPESMVLDLSGEFLDRDVQWLEFNARVLNEAADPRTPLLERVKFLGIFNSNLDEFFMKRIGPLTQHALMGLLRKGSSVTPSELLKKLHMKTRELLKIQDHIFQNDILPALTKNQIQLLKWGELTASEKAFAEDFFRKNIFPILTPLAVDPGIPFPFISNLSTSLAVALRDPSQSDRLFARIKVPKNFPQWTELKTTEGDAKRFRFISLIELITNNLKGLFPDMEILEVMPFRITRNIEVEREEDDAEDLLEMVAEELKQRRFGDLVRLEHGPDPDPWMLRFLREEMELTDEMVYERPQLMDYTDLKAIAELDLQELRYPPWNPLVPPRLISESQSLFEVISKDDLLVHHPFESFNQSVERFIRQAVEDKHTLAIKMTLYRTGDDSPFVPLLIRAAEMGKQVVVLIELKARFDEERNIHWAQTLENAGVHVVYGVVGLKTHAKTALVVRQEPEGIRCYAHIGTGNYHRTTARIYTDFGLFTSKLEVTEDVVELFHFLTGRSLKRNYHKLLVAPFNLRDQLIEQIKAETENAKKGKPARIIIKCNSVEEVGFCRSLYDASKGGVEIDLIVRGFCCLRPGVPGLSEKIRVTSVIGRFLEHARAFYFANGEKDPLKGKFFIGSADMMYRNLMARVEALVAVEDLSAREKIWEAFEINLSDRRSAWVMRPDGTYVQHQPKTDQEKLSSQERLMTATRNRHARLLSELDQTQVQADLLKTQ